MTYQIIYADPPWTYRDKANSGKRGVDFKYKTMDLADICRLPIWELAGESCLLAMWWVWNSTDKRAFTNDCDIKQRNYRGWGKGQRAETS